MNQHSEKKRRYHMPIKTVFVMMVVFSAVWMASAFRDSTDPADFGVKADHGVKNEKMVKDSIESVKAFMKVYKVLISPRCMNCHPAGDAPLQGDDSHIHTMNVVRGPDGTGLYAAKCSNCHQPTNVPGLHTPPGNPKWQLPPANMKMVFQGKTARQLALQIMNYNLNGHKTNKMIAMHGIHS
jgi:hypothetical protein